MIIVNLKGGLGNQMFQYALAFVLAKKKNCELYCDTRLQEFYQKNPPPRNVPRNVELDLFGIKVLNPSKKLLSSFFLNFKNHKIRRYISILFSFFNFRIFFERGRVFEKRVFENKTKKMYLDGYWQSERYFNNNRAEILELYSFNDLKKNNQNLTFLKNINIEDSVCLNVRRSDFINNPEHNTTDNNYFKEAVDLIENKKGKELQFYIFSDDIEWCKKNLKFIKNKSIVSHKFAGKKFFNYLYLMSNFKNYIIPNSTFAWWAAWLSRHDNKLVIAPKKWSGLYDNDKIDIVPSDWIRI